MIGHSLGAGTTFCAMARDDRIRAGVLSCRALAGLGTHGFHQFYREAGKGVFYHELLALIAPRCVLATRGRHEQPFTAKGDFGSAEEAQQVFEWCYAYGRQISEHYQSSEDGMVARLFEGGHTFPEAERDFAYGWLDTQLNQVITTPGTLINKAKAGSE